MGKNSTYRSKKIWGIISAAALIIPMTACSDTYTDPNEPVNRIDEEITYGEDDLVTTPRKLLEASEETIKYAGLVEASGRYRYSYDHSFGAGSSYLDNGIKESYDGVITYSGRRDESGNTSSVLSGNIDYLHEIDMYDFQRITNSDGTERKDARYDYYRQSTEAGEEERFVFFGSGEICDKIDIEGILIPDISQAVVEDVLVIDDTIKIKMTGDMHFLTDAIGEKITGRKLISEAYYEFDANTRELKQVRVSGSDKNDQSRVNTIGSGQRNNNNSYTFEDIETEIFDLELVIENISNTPSEMIEIPDTVCENGNINNLILNDGEFKFGDTVSSPFNMESEASEVVGNIWTEVTTNIGKETCSVKEIQNALAEIAQNYGCDDVRTGYAAVGQDDLNGKYDTGVLLKYELLAEGNVKYVMVVPVIFTDNEASSNTCIALDGEDYVKVGYEGSMDFVHDCTPGCQYHAKYILMADGTVKEMYEEIKQGKISELEDETNLAVFPEEDRETLKSMAESLDIAQIAGIIRFGISEKDTEDVDPSGIGVNYEELEDTIKYHYVIDYDIGDKKVNEIKEQYSLDIITQKEKDNMISKKKLNVEEDEIEWMQIFDE
ncbi:hypothetical protein D6853_10350 [Butyrivibrio sp. X503]|uniref:hypothetical protein n=1 Tax=Butyrivibrio sp. X503 TaxID=2364878 RepID=UPI000EA8D217|nr:hypothetical protein [Butyrivibrio sp. X503]RKM55130.1 hypothetical protein D6853_10350 [Butyrivibrio sp. X503]